MSSEELTAEDRDNISFLEYLQERYVNDEMDQEDIERFRSDYPDLVEIWEHKKMGKYCDDCKEAFMKGEMSEEAINTFRNGCAVVRQLLAGWQRELDEKNADQNPPANE